MVITSLRKYYGTFTASRLFVDGKLFGEHLEDAARPEGVKVPAVTCIPEATYLVKITMSTRFGKLMPILYNVAADLSINVRGVVFTGVRAHDGVTTEHTEGCILVGDQVDSAKGTLAGRKAAQLQALIQAAIDRGETIFWTFTRDPQ